MVSITRPYSAIVGYLLFNAGPDVNKKFAYMVRSARRNQRHHYKSEQEWEDHKRVNNKCQSDIGNVVNALQKGASTTLTKDQIENLDLKEYFKFRGQHFCYGYLSKFEKVDYINNKFNKNTIGTPIINYFKKLKEKDAYNAALEVLQSYHTTSIRSITILNKT